MTDISAWTRKRKMHARGALHVAMMERHKVEKFMGFDEGFDGYPGVERVVL